MRKCQPRYRPKMTTSPSDVGRARMLRLCRDLELPDSWVPEGMKPARVPERTGNDYATLAAWYGPFGMFDHARRICLANCREWLRAQFAAEGKKVSEKKLDDLAHRHEEYVQFLHDHLLGRIEYFKEHMKQGLGS